MSPLEKNIMKPRRKYIEKEAKDAFEEKVIEVSRVSRTVKGGRRIRFRALVVIGDKNGKVGMGLGKSSEVSGAVQKAAAQARKNIVQIPIINGTIPHEMIGEFGAAKVLIRPASEGTSVVAGGSVRVVAELAGIQDLLAKSLGSRSKINNIAATINGLKSFNKNVVDTIKKYDKNIQNDIKIEDKSAKTEPNSASKTNKKILNSESKK